MFDSIKNYVPILLGIIVGGLFVLPFTRFTSYFNEITLLYKILYVVVILFLIILILYLLKHLKIIIQHHFYPPADIQNYTKTKDNLIDSWNVAKTKLKLNKWKRKSSILILGEKKLLPDSILKILNSYGDIRPQTLNTGSVENQILDTKNFVIFNLTGHCFELDNDWKHFFKTLSKDRKKDTPFDSIIITIQAPLMIDDSAKIGPMNSNLKKIKKCVSSISYEFNVDIPIYVLFPELESIHGFSEFVKNLDKKELKDEVLGWSPKEVQKKIKQNDISESFTDISDEIEKKVILAEKNIDDVDTGFKIYAFQHEFRKMETSLINNLNYIFPIENEEEEEEEEDGEGCIICRGYYFTGIKKEEKEEKDTSSVFINALFNKIYKERHLVRQSDSAIRVEKKKKIGVFIGVVLFLLALIFITMYFYNFNSKMTMYNNKIYGQVKPYIKNYNIVDHTESTIKNIDDCLEYMDELLFIKYIMNVPHDLKKIKNSFLLNTLFRPVINQSSNKLKNLELPSDKSLLIDAINQNLRLIIGKKFSDINPENLINLLPLKKIEKINIENLWKRYGKNKNVPKTDLTELVLNVRFGLGNLYNFWINDCRDLLNKREIHIIKIENKYNGTLAVINNHQEELNNVLSEMEALRDTLSNIKKEHILENPGKECEDIYTSFTEIISASNNTGLQDYLKKTISRHSLICTQLKTSHETINKSRNYIWDKKGEVAKEINDIVLVLKKAETAYKEFLSASDEQKINVKKLELSKKTAEEYFEETLKNISSPQWKKDKLHEAILYWLNLLFDNLYNKNIENNRNRLRRIRNNKVKPVTTMKTNQSTHSLKDLALTTTNRNNSENDIPLNCQPVYLINEIKKISELLVEGFNETNKKDIANIYNDFITFWYNKLQSFDPASSVIEMRSWADFRKRVLSIKGKFIDTQQQPLKNFLVHVSRSKIKQLKRFTSEEYLENNQMKENILLDFSDRYSNPRFIDKLDATQKNFLNQIDSLDKNYSMENLDNLRLFSNFIDNCSFQYSQLHFKRLTIIENHALKLLKINTLQNMRLRFNLFVEKWFIFDRYPFIKYIQENITKNYDKSICSETISIETVSLKELRNFFYDKNIGLEKYIKTYRVMDPPYDQILNEKEKIFLETCQAWKNFLFDEKKHLKKHQVTFYLDISLQLQDRVQSKQELFIGNRFTKLTIRELFGHNEFRTSGDQKKLSSELRINSINRITLKANKESKTYKPKKNYSELILTGGDLFLIAYIKNQEHEKCEYTIDDKTICHVKMNLPVYELISKTNKYVEVRFKIEWDGKIPEYICWPN